MANGTQQMQGICLRQYGRFAGIQAGIGSVADENRLALVSFLSLGRHAATRRERNRFFELAEMYSWMARQETTESNAAQFRSVGSVSVEQRAIGPLTEYQTGLIKILMRARHARTAEERARFFTMAEEWSERARATEQLASDGKSLPEAGF